MKGLEILVYAIIFSIPAYLIRFSVFGVPTNVLEILVGAAFIWWMKENFQSMFNFQFSKRRGLFTMASGVLLIFIGLLFGTFVSPDTRASLGVLKGWFLTPLAFFIMARSVLDTKEKKEKALWSLALSGIAVGVIALFYWLTGRLTFDERLAAFYESPNMLAMYLAPALLIVTLALSQKVKVKSQKFLLFSFAFLIFILALTRSLGAFAGVGGALAFYFSTLRWGKVWEKLGIYIFGSIIIAGILLPLSPLFIDPWEMERSSLASRLMIWRASVEILKDHWLFGIGPGTFQEAYLAYQKNFPLYLEWAVPHPHNIFLMIWLYAGVLGLAGLLMILSSALGKPIHYYPISFIFLYLLIHGIFDNTLLRNDAGIIFWTLLALKAHPLYRRDR